MAADGPEWADESQHKGFFQGFGHDDNVDPPPRRKRRKGKFAAPLISLIVVLALLGAGGYFAVSWYSSRHANYTGQGTGEVV